MEKLKTQKDLKEMTKEDFLKLDGATEEIYNNIQKSREGYIWIRKISPTKDESHDGYTYIFGEGVSCSIDKPTEWYRTSVIQKIDWDKSEFTTLNSIYEFKFTENVKDES